LGVFGVLGVFGALGVFGGGCRKAKFKHAYISNVR